MASQTHCLHSHLNGARLRPSSSTRANRQLAVLLGDGNIDCSFLNRLFCKNNKCRNFRYRNVTFTCLNVYLKVFLVNMSWFNPNPLAILAKNLPESAKIQHHAVTLPPNCWTWLELGHPAPCKVSLSGLYSTESIKIQHHAETLPPNCWT